MYLYPFIYLFSVEKGDELRAILKEMHLTCVAHVCVFMRVPSKGGEPSKKC
jgi:hypothetical protein